MPAVIIFLYLILFPVPGAIFCFPCFFQNTLMFFATASAAHEYQLANRLLSSFRGQETQNNFRIATKSARHLTVSG